ncbi:ricin-type beta-trefoil lectin domain protein [Collimonas arenae]|uniref:Ricin-type beta-trefoil lectin domain protein n=1 Tax=Collimonas arenae TaxID=279058 RepID=A0A127PRM2_9BURK|nr:RICIN domain-containing protein [Collimonas arenae]AMP00285.1 ricin-type beta-trefoil lectin domain protein [Collimonas arenae]AMP10162.1 ricin-type beta-trefoil lectin domain protein [Collimonas arenae]
MSNRNQKMSRYVGISLLTFSCFVFIPAAGAGQPLATTYPNGEIYNYPIRSIISFASSVDVIGSKLAQSLSSSVFQGESLDEKTLGSSFGGRHNTTLTYLDGATILSNVNSLKRSKILLDAGVPLLIRVDRNQLEVGKQVAALFGVSIRSGYMLLSKDGPAKLTVFNLQAPDNTAIPNGLMQALGAVKQKNVLPSLRANIRALETDQVGIPKVTLNLNSADVTGQIVSIVNLDLIRSASRGNDKKFIVVKATPTVRSTRNGVVIGSAPNNNLWGAYLPHQYSISHEVSGTALTPILVSSDPPSDSRTEFTYTETKTHGFTIGGSFGAEGGGEHTDKWKYIAKTPFNINAGISYTNTKTLTNIFKDYSLLAAPAIGKIKWDLFIDPKLKFVLVERETAGLPTLNENRMTPMMRSASMETYSTWELPGNYEGLATLKIGGGYILDRREWWYDRSDVKRRYETDTFETLDDIILDFGSPYLTREMTVLIRSADGHGKCVGDQSGQAKLLSCSPADKSQLWGLDSESRYVNRLSGKCLTADVQSGELKTAACGIDNAQQWDWRADRIHSRYDRNWRLYSTADMLKVIPDSSMLFEDIPLNSFNRLNIPWASYPGAPSANDVMPNLNGPSPQISPDWIGKYHAADARQRWNIEILRDGI